MKAKNVKVTTTAGFDGIEIEEYLEPITAHVVVGMNFFKDFISGFTDFFGGNSSSYQNTLTSINNEVINELRRKAYSIGGNCVLGLKIDNDEISAQGKSMMMVTALGTVARAKFSIKSIDVTKEERANRISNEYFLFLKQKKKYLLLCTNDTLNINDDFWRFAKTNKVNEFAPHLLDQYFNLLANSLDYENENLIDFKNNVTEYFAEIDSDIVIECLHNKLLKKLNYKLRDESVKLITDLQLLDYSRIILLINDQIFAVQKCGVQLLKGEKLSYEKSDIEHLVNLKTLISNNFKEHGERTTKKKALSSKLKEIWICECGKENNSDIEYCQSCMNNIYGFSKLELNPKEATDKLSLEIEILNESIK
ncbi:MAG: hypothetical protein COC06_11765 [Bacteroidales bacterium]|nr:MAG: hypothetical protein COC06_11765 [Bacteroidales bacterium]